MSNNNYSAMSVINDLMMSDGGDNSSVMSNSSSMSTGNVSAGGGSVSLSTLIQHWKADSGSLDGIIIAVFVLIGLVAVVTNSLVVISVALNKNLRAPLDTAIASLAVIDIVTGVVGIPVIILVYQSEHILSQPIQYWKIKLLWSTVDVLTLLSVWHVLVITIDRFIAIFYPYKYINFKESRKGFSVVTILAGWMLAILVCFVPILILYDIGDDQALEDDQHWQLSKLIFAGILIYIGHGLPLCVIFGLNIRLLMFIARHERRSHLEEEVGRVMAKTISNVWLSCLVSACIIVAYVPYLVKWQIEAWDPVTPPKYKVSPFISLVIQILFALNSVVNPVIYAFQMPAYRYIYRYILRAVCCCSKQRNLRQRSSQRTMRL